MQSINIVLALLAAGALRVNILSSYHIKEATITSRGQKDVLTVRDNYLYVNEQSRDRYWAPDSFTIAWGEKSRSYQGSLEGWVKMGELVMVNRVNEDDYLASVVGAEMVPGAKLEALKAQAVLCRTFIYKETRHKGEGWNFCDLTHCQSYRGDETVTARTRLAVEETGRLVLTYRNELCKVYYHSTSGGATADASNIWPDEHASYLVSVKDPYCSSSPHYRWQYVARADDLAQALGLPHISEIKIVEAADDGRVKRIAIKGSESVVLDGWNFRMLVSQSLGWNTLKSSWFQVEADAGSFIFKGKGLGHGVGLSQWGAKGMADAGKGFKEILLHYYPGTEITKWH